MKVKVIFTSTLRTIVGQKELEINLKYCSTIRDLLGVLCGIYGKEFKEYVGDIYKDGFKLSVLVNGELEPIDCLLENGDEVLFLNLMGGG